MYLRRTNATDMRWTSFRARGSGRRRKPTTTSDLWPRCKVGRVKELALQLATNSKHSAVRFSGLAWSVARARNSAPAACARHKQAVGHPLLKVPDYMRLGSRDRDREHVAVGGPELDHVATIVFRAVDHDAVLAGHQNHDS